MAWAPELIVTYTSIEDLINAGNETGVNKIANGTIAIVEGDNNNFYIFNGNINKWRPQDGNVYHTNNLPTAVDFHLEFGIEVNDSQYKLKRKWTGVEWELQKTVENIMIAGNGAPSNDVGEYGNIYTDLETDNVYIKNIAIKTKIDLLSMYDAGTLTLSTSSPYTLKYPREFFVDRIADWDEGLPSQKSMVTSSTAANGYLLFDFNGSPQKIDTITMIFGDAPYDPVVTSLTWQASNDLITWQDLVVFTSNLTKHNCVQGDIAALTEYRYYRMSFVRGANNYVPLRDLFFYKSGSDYTWNLITKSQSPEILYSLGAPLTSIGIKDSKCIDLLTGDVYYKNSTANGRVAPVSYVSNETHTYFLFNRIFYTESTVGGRNRLVLDFGSVIRLDRVIFYCKPPANVELTLFHIFGGDNVVWSLIHRSPVKSTTGQTIELDLTSILVNRSYRYFRIHWYCNYGFTEWEFYSDTNVTWSLSHNLNDLITTSFDNKLNSSVTNLQALAEYVDNQNPTVAVVTHKTVTAAEFNIGTRFKITNTEPLTVTLPTLTSTHNNKCIEIIKLGKGDVVINGGTCPISSSGQYVLSGNTGGVGESVVLEYVHEILMFIIRNSHGNWVSGISLPTYATISSVTVGVDGRTWTMIYSSAVTSGIDGFNNGFVTSAVWGGIQILSYQSGGGSNTLIYQSNTYIDSTDTFAGGLNYTQPGQGINGIDNHSIVSFTGQTIINNSSLTLPQLTSCTIEADGLTWTFVFDRSMNVGASPNAFTIVMTTAGNIPLTYSSGNGSNTIIFTGSTIVPTNDTVLDGLNYDATNKSFKSVEYSLALKSITDFSINNNSAA